MQFCKCVFCLEYEVHVVTGSFPEAGTTANVSITIYGKHGVSRKIGLHGDSAKKQNFKRGSKDTFHVATESRVHPVSKIRCEKL